MSFGKFSVEQFSVCRVYMPCVTPFLCCTDTVCSLVKVEACPSDCFIIYHPLYCSNFRQYPWNLGFFCEYCRYNMGCHCPDSSFVLLGKTKIDTSCFINKFSELSSALTSEMVLNVKCSVLLLHCTVFLRSSKWWE